MFVNVGKADFIGSKVFHAHNKEIAVFNIDGEYFAIDNHCPHKGIGLCDGMVDGYVVSCPGHGWEFDLKTGKGVRMPVSVNRYNVTIKDGELHIEI